MTMIRMYSGNTSVPVTRNMPFTSTSVPSRGSNIKNNMTGIYLGLEGNLKPPKPRSATVPPLIRRCGSQRIRTPTEQRSYNKVELLRVKEETRGFRGQPVKRKKQVDLDHAPEQGKENVSPRSRAKQWGPAKSINSNEFADIIRQNPRRYTVVVNNGVTRSENLTGFHSFVENPGADVLNIPYSEVLIEEVHRITNNRDLVGLEECYKKVCKGKMDSLQSLLPLRKNGQHRENSFATGFTVRSYQNPQRAEILADFDGTQMSSRPKTVPVNRQPLVPAPYFFRFYNKPGTATSQRTRKTPASQFEDQFDTLHGTAKIIAAPGVGVLSRSLKVKNNAWSDASGETNPNKPLRMGNWNSATDSTSGKDIEGRPRVQISPQEAADTEKHSVQLLAADSTRRQDSEGALSQSEAVDIPSTARTEEWPSTGQEALTDRSELSTGREERNREDSKTLSQTPHLETSISDKLSEDPILLAEPGLAESVTQAKILNDMDGRIRGDDHQMKTERELMKAKRANSADIVLELETEDGQHTDVHIDDAQLKDGC
ncbi:hypothetical protein CHS0354_015753 [Potamilus streckersoni]|uniref:Uncharacterized protein n=1 Tax=Potamilus streckersoni TaxID=2493646 RepID=A0AAE0W7H3_9BIVA|nr:hypothetical protein CHS0354_015753 [Potamilus streckersoni]